MGKEKGHPQTALSDSVGNENIPPVSFDGELEPGFEPGLLFTGQVVGLVNRPHNGFANYSVVTLILNKGHVVKAHFGQAMAGFEAQAHIKIKNEALLDLARKYYPPGFESALI